MVQNNQFNYDNDFDNEENQKHADNYAYNFD